MTVLPGIHRALLCALKCQLMFRLTFRLTPLIVLLLTLTCLRSAEIREVHWGFDGKVIPEHFNPLALLVYNPGPAPFEGALELTEGTIVHQGAPWRMVCYLAPGTSRWVEFQPWIGNHIESFQVRWLPAGNTSDIDQPNFGSPATIVLADAGRLGLTIKTFKTFPDEIFPSSVLATDGLACVVIDHAPRWQPAQRQAFRDWLWRGGTVFVLPSIDGSNIRFTQELEFLNQKKDTTATTTASQSFGAGVVIHYHGERSEFGPATLVAHGITMPTLHEEKSYLSPFTSDLFQMLAQLVKPNHPWGLIYLLLIGYVLLIGPGAWFAARKGMDFRTLNIAIAASIIGCAALMWIVGKRGYGERASLTTIAYAHALGGGEFATTQWSSCFVTSSDRYALKHPGNDNLFACPNDNEKVDALIANDGNGNQLNASIPLYSSRSFVHGGRISIAELEPQIQTITMADDQIKTLEIIIPGKSATGKNWVDLCSNAKALYQGQMCTLIRNNQGFVLSGTGTPLANFIATVNENVNHHFGNNRGDPFSDDSPDDNLNIGRLDQRFAPLIAYGLGGHGVVRQWSEQRQSSDLVTLFLLVDHPPSFQLSSGISQQGRVVFRFDLPVPVRKTP